MASSGSPRNSTESSEKAPPRWMLTLGIGVGILAISSAALLIRLAQVPPISIATYRMGFASVILWIIFPFAHHRSTASIPWKSVVMAGFFIALHFALWITSLESTSVASSLVLVTMNPIIVAIGSAFLLREIPPRALIWGTGVSIIGSGILIIGEGFSISNSWRGNSLALGGAVAMSCYILIGRSARSKTDLISYVTWVYSIAACFLLMFSFFSRIPLWGFDTKTYAILAAIAVIPQIIGHSSINWALKYLHASFLAAAILVEPFIGSFLAYLVLEESFSSWTVLGGVLILGGVMAAFRTAK